MRRFWRVLRRVLVVLAALLLIGLAIVYAATTAMLNATYDFAVAPLPAASDPAALERGRHLAENVAQCAGCHGADYGGKILFDPGFLVGRLASPNLTRGRGGVVTAYTPADWVRAIRHGVSAKGRPLILMPAADFNTLTANDLAAIIAYLETRPPVDREWPAPTLGPVGRMLLLAKSGMLLPVRAIDHTKPIATAPPGDLVAKGDQLASLSGCRGCHAPDLTGGSGPPPGGANITPVGLAGWTEADFVRTLRTGHTPDQRELDPAMPRFSLADDELHALWSYLCTVPAKGKKTVRQERH